MLNSDMAFELLLEMECFLADVASERLLASMQHPVLFHMDHPPETRKANITGVRAIVIMNPETWFAKIKS